MIFDQKIGLYIQDSQKNDYKHQISSKMMISLLVMMSSFMIYNNQGPTYTVEKKTGNFQVRLYNSWIVAQTTVKGTHENAGHQAFSLLGGYIFGANDGNIKIDMTAPVTQKKVGQDQYLVQFYMPNGWTLDTLPKPRDQRVILKALPERRIFAQRYVGGWSQELYSRQLDQAKIELVNEQLSSKGEPIWAKYNDPMTPSFLRTNQIMFQI